MTTNYVLCDYSKVRETAPEFNSTLQALHASLVQSAERDWSPLKYGGMSPKPGQFGESTIMPSLFMGMAGTTLQTWAQTLTATGSQTVIQGSNAGQILEDYKIGIVGIAFLDKALRCTEIRMDVSDKRLGRLNLEETMGYDAPTVVLENGYLLDEKTNFTLRAFVDSIGPQRIKLLGIQMNRVPNKLQASAPGALLT